MKESVTYQAIVEERKMEGIFEGKVAARQEVGLDLGQKRFGPLSPQSETALRNITDPERLSNVIRALLDVSSWEELLSTK